MISAEQPHVTLKRNCLSYSEVIAQSISVIAPATVPAALMGLFFASAGNGTWLSILLCMVGLLFVSLNINQFARRSASPGSLYAYIVKGIGPEAGFLSGWSLLLGYVFTGMSTLCGFAIFAQVLLEHAGIASPVWPLFMIGTLVAGAVAWRDIQLSANVMLILEGLSILAILALGVIIWAHKGFAIDPAQITLQGATPAGVLSAIVLVVFAFSGFESSTSLGDEAKNPLRTIPRSLIQSTLISGLFFIFMGYVIILGFQGSGADLGKTEAPLDFLAPRAGLGFMGEIINIGALLSFFSCTLACINSSARLVFSMASHGIFHNAFGITHAKNETPHVAVALSALVTFLLPTLIYFSGVHVFDAQGYFGAAASFGFLFVYILVSIAAPFYLRTLGKLNARALACAVVAVAFMLLPVAGTIGIPGSAILPPPEFPYNILPWAFIAYMIAGFAWLRFQHLRSPALTRNMREAVDEIHLKFQETDIEEVR